MNVLFVCVASSGRGVIAERLFSEPGAAPHPQVVEALREVGIDATDHVPRKLDQEMLEWADVAVSTCGEGVCPVTPGVRRISWVFEGPKDLLLKRVREIRDEIEHSVEQLVQDLDAGIGATDG